MPGRDRKPAADLVPPPRAVPGRAAGGGVDLGVCRPCSRATARRPGRDQAVACPRGQAHRGRAGLGRVLAGRRGTPGQIAVSREYVAGGGCGHRLAVGLLAERRRCHAGGAAGVCGFTGVGLREAGHGVWALPCGFPGWHP
jgi:hypothetical protein